MIDYICLSSSESLMLSYEILYLSYVDLYTIYILSRERYDELYHLLRYWELSEVRWREDEDTIGSGITHPVRIDRVVCIDAEYLRRIESDSLLLWKSRREGEWGTFLHMLWYAHIPYVLVVHIEKCPSLSRSCILIDIILHGDIFLRGECSSIPLPATGIGCYISIEEMVVEPLRWRTPVCTRHIAYYTCCVHT